MVQGNKVQDSESELESPSHVGCCPTGPPYRDLQLGLPCCIKTKSKEPPCIVLWFPSLGTPECTPVTAVAWRLRGDYRLQPGCHTKPADQEYSVCPSGKARSWQWLPLPQPLTSSSPPPSKIKTHGCEKQGLFFPLRIPLQRRA